MLVHAVGTSSVRSVGRTKSTGRCHRRSDPQIEKKAKPKLVLTIRSHRDAENDCNGQGRWGVYEVTAESLRYKRKWDGCSEQVGLFT